MRWLNALTDCSNAQLLDPQVKCGTSDCPECQASDYICSQMSAEEQSRPNDDCGNENSCKERERDGPKKYSCVRGEGGVKRHFHPSGN